MRRKKEAQKTIIILKNIFQYQRLALKSPTDNWFLIFDPSSVEKFPCQVDTYGPWLSATLFCYTFDIKGTFIFIFSSKTSHGDSGSWVWFDWFEFNLTLNVMRFSFFRHLEQHQACELEGWCYTSHRDSHTLGHTYTLPRASLAE